MFFFLSVSSFTPEGLSSVKDFCPLCSSFLESTESAQDKNCRLARSSSWFRCECTLRRYLEQLDDLNLHEVTDGLSRIPKCCREETTKTPGPNECPWRLRQRCALRSRLVLDWSTESSWGEVSRTICGCGAPLIAVNLTARSTVGLALGSSASSSNPSLATPSSVIIWIQW